MDSTPQSGTFKKHYYRPKLCTGILGLAHCYIYSHYRPPRRPRRHIKGKGGGNEALEIDEALAEAYIPLAYIAFFQEWDWAGAETEYKRSIELNPQLCTERHYYSIFLVYMERFDEALEHQNCAAT